MNGLYAWTFKGRISHQHHTDNSATARRSKKRLQPESGTVFWAEERHFLAMLVHLSPEGGQVVSALFLGSVLMFTSPTPPPFSLLLEKTPGLWSVLAKTHTTRPTSAIIKTAILYTSPAVFQGPDKRFVYVCKSVSHKKKNRLNSICASLTCRRSW